MPSDKLNISDKPHIIIRASAGSGKTYQLSNRYLDLLHRDASPSTILATTFTRKAAGEILERILRRLAEAVIHADKRQVLAAAFAPEDSRDHQPLTLSRVRAMLVSLCRSLHRASVSTIDSFFHRIASSFRYELKLPPDPRMVEAGDALAVRLRLQAIEAMLGDEDVEVLIDLLKRLHHDQTRRGITQAIDDIVADLYDTYRVTQRHHWEQLDPPQPLSLDEVAQLVSGLGALLESAPNKTFARALATARDHAMRSDWESFLGTGLAAKILADPDEPVFNRAPITADQLAIFLPLIAHAKAALLTFLARQTAATYDLLHRFDAHYTRLREQQRLLLYSDLPFKLAHELPRQDETLLTEICYRLDGAVSHLLLDEFQDTSFDQWRVLAPFAEEVTSYSDGSRTFFCVGDVKQAIYGWRGGRAELFNQIPAQLNLTDEAQVMLDVSYRSSQIVLDVVNEVFKSLPASPVWTAGENDCGEVTRWARDFRDHRASDPALPGYVEFITSPVIAKASGPSPQNSEASEQDQDDDVAALPPAYEEFVADRIAQLHRQMPGRSIGVLVGTNSAATPLLRRLRELGVDASAEGRDALVNDSAVEVVLSALRLADHPGHTAAAFHVLNSPLAGIIGLESIRPRATATLALQIRSQIIARGFAAVLAQWAYALAASCDAGNVRKLLQLIELADRYEIDASARLGPFIDAVEHTTFEEPSTSPVRVMTIHKSKGLEFDVVVLPQLDKKMGRIGTNQGVTILRDPQTDEVQAVYRSTNQCTRVLSESVQEAYEQERMRRLRDDLCMLYVAMTRAKGALHLITEPVKMNKTGLSKRGLSDQSFASVLRHALCDDPTSEDPSGRQTLFTRGNPNWAPAPKPGALPPTATAAAPAARLPAAIDRSPGAVQRSWRIISPSSLHQQRQRSIGDLLAITPDEARSRGSLIHGWFELIQWLDDHHDVPGDQELTETSRHLLPMRPAMEKNDAWLQQQIADFRRMLGQAAVMQSLTPPAPGKGEEVELWRERAFAVRIKDELLRGTFDRVVIVRQSRAAVRAQLIDFKTDRIRSRQDLDDRCEHYRPQMEAYRAALAAMLQLPRQRIQATLLFVHDGQRCEV